MGVVCRSPFCYNSSMISEYFYMPRTNKKVTEEDRIKFTTAQATIRKRSKPGRS